MTEILRRLNSSIFSPAPCFANRCFWCNQRALVDGSGIIRTRGCTIDQKMASVLGTFSMIPPCNSKEYPSFLYSHSYLANFIPSLYRVQTLPPHTRSETWNFICCHRNRCRYCNHCSCLFQRRLQVIVIFIINFFHSQIRITILRNVLS
jgi:hypothetical protein